MLDFATIMRKAEEANQKAMAELERKNRPPAHPNPSVPSESTRVNTIVQMTQLPVEKQARNISVSVDECEKTIPIPVI